MAGQSRRETGNHSGSAIARSRPQKEAPSVSPPWSLGPRRCQTRHRNFGSPGLERPPDLQFNFTPWSDASHDARGAVAHPFPGFSLSAVHLRPDARVAASAFRALIRCNRRVRREDTRNCALQPASGWYFPHGIRGRLSRGPASSRVWHRWASGGQCGNHADGICRQHQCTNDHDCGKGRRHDFGGRHIAIIKVSLRCTLQNSANGPFTWPWMFERNAVWLEDLSEWNVGHGLQRL